MFYTARGQKIALTQTGIAVHEVIVSVKKLLCLCMYDVPEHTFMPILKRVHVSV